ncbi:5'/3'-nucleotidase SurE [Streptomyces sp. NPDC049687]|uniref:5'/3'-nucleotidase SurE n=1 Tax=Streptomyces sp. NPDC049687 TaxID=3365596 RepID=UPI0037AC7DDF
MRVLVTNDDGVHSDGLRPLTDALTRAGHDVLAVAPLADHSGTGTALGLRPGVPVRVVSVEDEPGGPRVLGIDGGPALAVTLARMGAFGDRPQAVLSGINAGANTGRSVLHSATVGAALTASAAGLSALAVSVAADRPRHWAAAAQVAVDCLAWLGGARRRTVLNVNIPDLPLEQLRGVRYGRLAAFGPTSLVAVPQDGGIVVEERSQALPLDPETDTALVLDGWVTTTLLDPLTGVPARDAPVGLAALHLPGPPATLGEEMG